MIRLCVYWVWKVYSSKEKVAPHLQEFINLFLKPFYDDSIILTQRQAMRESEFLNQYLFDNLALLKAIFEWSKNITPGGLNLFKSSSASTKSAAGSSSISWERITKAKNHRKFTIYHAYKLFGNITDPNYEVDKRIIDQCFQFCQMTVLDEVNNINKYNYLTFIEFVDMLCRIVVTGVKLVDTIDYQLHYLLELVYKQVV